jgi:hypothetical protein
MFIGTLCFTFGSPFPNAFNLLSVFTTKRSIALAHAFNKSAYKPRWEEYLGSRLRLAKSLSPNRASCHLPMILCTPCHLAKRILPHLSITYITVTVHLAIQKFSVILC